MKKTWEVIDDKVRLIVKPTGEMAEILLSELLKDPLVKKAVEENREIWIDKILVKPNGDADFIIKIYRAK